MNKKTFLRVWIISIAILLVSSSLICSNAKAQGGWGFMSGGSQWNSPSWGYNGGNSSTGYPSRGYSSYPSGGGYGGGFSMGFPSYSSAGYGANSLMSYPSNFFGGYGGNYSQIPMPLNISMPASTGSTSSSSSVQTSTGGNNDAWASFIAGLQEKYPDLEGIDWDTWETWTDEDWQKLQEALSAERSAETLAQFKADVIKKWSAYDSNAWEEFNSNWNAFIVDAAADENGDIELTWAGFIATYGCFGTSDPENGPNPDDVYCWQNYSSWTDKQWKAFRGIYNSYLDHEWKLFYKTLQSKMSDYNTIDWENWRDWTDADWESCLTKVSSGSAKLVTSTSLTPPTPLLPSSPSSSLSGYTGWGFPGISSMGYAGFGAPSASNIGYAAFGGQTGGFNSAQMGYGLSAPSTGYGWGAPGMGYTGGWGGQTGYAGFGAPMGYGRGYGRW